MKGMIFENIKRSWTLHRGIQITTLVILSATSTLMLTMLLVSQNMNRLVKSWGSELKMTVYLKDDIAEGQVEILREKFKANELIGQVDLVSKEKAREDFSKSMGSFMPKALEDKDFGNPFPASFKLKPRPELFSSQASVSSLEKWAKSLVSLVGVEEVSFGKKWLENYQSFIIGMRVIGSILFLSLVIGSIFVIGNALKTSIAHRKEEIEILELVGATPKMIRSPYIYEGALLAFLGSGIGLSICFGLFVFTKSVVLKNFSFLSMTGSFDFLNWMSIMLVLSAATMLGALGSWLMVMKYNDGWAAKQGITSV